MEVLQQGGRLHNISLLCGIEKPWVQGNEKAELSIETEEAETHVFLAISAHAIVDLIEENDEASRYPLKKLQ